MKKLVVLFLLIILTSNIFCQERIPTVDITLPKHELYLASGITFIGLSLSIKPVLIRNQRPIYLQPEVAIPLTLGIGFTIAGFIEGIKFERKEKKHFY